MTVRASTATAPGDAPGALIVGGAHGSLAIARSLGRRGIPVWFVTHDHPLAKFSRYVSRRLTWDGPDHRDAVAYLLDLARSHRLQGWVLFAGGDAEVRLVSQHHAELSAVFRVAAPTWDVAKWAYDKRLTYARAASLGLDYPWSHYPRDARDVAQLECRFPVILKPTVREGQNAFTMAKAWRIDSRDELLARYAQAASLVGEHAIVLQEMIPGGGAAQFSYAAVWDNGTPVASLVAKRARQYPIEFGYTSTFVQTVEQQEVEDAACRFLSSLNYSGLVEIEFKFDERDQRYKMLDFNARAWTWAALGTTAGVDFPHLAYRLACGETVPRASAAGDASWVHLSRDLAAACHEILAGRLSLRDYLQSLRGPFAFAAFAKDDPLPGFVELPLVVFRVLSRRISSLAKAVQASLRGPAKLQATIPDRR
jgi:predicted ATP-grasp superfamily ATP-dependent carboligase